MTTRTRLALVAVGTAFAGILLFVTLRSTSTPLDLAAAERSAAQRACHDAVRARLADARFPLDPTVEARGGGHLHLSGSVDAGPASRAVRRNYACLLRRDGAGSYTPDSVTVWQSH